MDHRYSSRKQKGWIEAFMSYRKSKTQQAAQVAA